MRVLTYNIAGHRGRDQLDYLKRIADLIVETGADVAGLQEVAMYADRVPPQVAFAALTGFHADFQAAHRSRGHILGNLIVSRTPLQEVSGHELPGQFPERRVLQEVLTSADGHPVTMYNTHLVHLSSAASLVRRRQIRRVVLEMRGCSTPYVLVGDMNAAPHSREFGSVRKLDPSRLGNHHHGLRSWPSRRPLIQYDHIWPGPGWQVLDVRVLDPHISDHRPVLAEIQWKQPAPIIP